MRSTQATSVLKTTTKTKTFDFDPSEYRSNLKQHQILQAKSSFDLLDTQRTGSINPRQIKQALQGLGNEGTQHPVYQLICEIQSDGNGIITFQDYLHLLSKRVTERDSEQDLRKVFTLYDDHKNGYLSLQSLRKVAEHIGEDITDEQLQKMVEYADKDRDGFVSFSDFYATLSRYSSSRS